MKNKVMMLTIAVAGMAQGATKKELFVIDSTWVANEYMWMVAVVSFAVCAVFLDVFVLGAEVRTFQSFDRYVEDLLAGNGARVRRDQIPGEF